MIIDANANGFSWTRMAASHTAHTAGPLNHDVSMGCDCD